MLIFYMLLHCGLCRLLLPNLVLMLPLDFKRGLLVLYGDCQFPKPIGTFTDPFIFYSDNIALVNLCPWDILLELLHIWWTIGVHSWSIGKLYLFFINDWLHYLECSAFQLLGLGEFTVLNFCLSVFPFHFLSSPLCSGGILCGPFCIFFLPFKLISFPFFNKNDIVISRIFKLAVIILKIWLGSL